MGKRPKRKIVLFLVEGKSDREALQLAIPELYDRVDEEIEVFFPIIRLEDEERGGDITSTYYYDRQGKKQWIHPKNIEDAIYMLFLADFFDKEKIMPKDISEIVQIVDTDGAFIPEEGVQAFSTTSEKGTIEYSDKCIKCTTPGNIIKRNRQKSENLRFLSTKTSIKVKQKSVPFSIYYFSCNLDHFLNHTANLEYQSKRSLADAYARNYIGNVEEFVNDICQDPDATQNMTYKESWDYIKEDYNSLRRHTNLNLLLSSLSI